MPYILMSTGPNPTQANECTLICNGEILDKLVQQFQVTVSGNKGIKTKSLLWKAFSCLRKKKNYPNLCVPEYVVPTNPHMVIDLLESNGYKLLTTTTNQKTFIWTFHKESPLESPINDKKPSQSQPQSTLASSSTDTICSQVVVEYDIPVRCIPCSNDDMNVELHGAAASRLVCSEASEPLSNILYHGS